MLSSLKKISRLNVRMLLRVIGILLLIEAGFMLIPLGVGLFYDEADVSVFAVSTAVTVVGGLLMVFAINPPHHDMGKREGFMLTSLVWVFFSLFGMLPFIFGTPRLNVSDAFFESMSGFTTTGASVLEMESLSHAIHVWRSLMQWIGGMGIILFTLAVLPMLNSAGGMQMFNAEVTGITHDKLKPRVSQTAKRLWGIYTLLTVVLLLLLWAGPMDFFDSVCHALSTMSTGGFSTQSASIVAWNSDYVKIVVTVFMFIGGINFALFYKAASSGSLREAWRNEAFRTYVLVIAVVYVVFVIVLAAKGIGDSVESLVVDPLFQIVSTISSTGYMVSGFENWGTFLLMLVFVMMFFGGCAGSTSGGAKIDRLLFFAKNMRNETYRVLHPNSVLPVTISGRTVSPETVSKVTAFLGLYGVVIVIGAMALTVFEVPLVDSLFTAFSCVSNTGLGAGITGYGGNYDIIPDAGKWILSLLMLIGRLELFTVIVLFTPGFWRR